MPAISRRLSPSQGRSRVIKTSTIFAEKKACEKNSLKNYRQVLGLLKKWL